MKVTKEQIIEMKELRESGWTYKKIADKMGIEFISTIRYYTVEECRKNQRLNSLKNYKKYSPEKKKELYEKQKSYQAVYFKKRYHEDEEFREKHKALARKCNKIKYDRGVNGKKES